VNKLLDDILKKIRNYTKSQTIEYIPLQQNLDKNKKHTLYTAAVFGGVHILPGDLTLVKTGIICYGTLKGYQAIRDWAGK
jgi:hypothetical protein